MFVRNGTAAIGIGGDRSAGAYRDGACALRGGLVGAALAVVARPLNGHPVGMDRGIRREGDGARDQAAGNESHVACADGSAGVNAENVRRRVGTTIDGQFVGGAGRFAAHKRYVGSANAVQALNAVHAVLRGAILLGRRAAIEIGDQHTRIFETERAVVRTALLVTLIVERKALLIIRGIRG